jgi:hypothetical protein
MKGNMHLAENERIMMDYLLGNLAESEAERLDQLSITDQEFGERLRAVENDLVDAYVRGELLEKDRMQFQAHYLATPNRQEKVRFAKALIQEIDMPRHQGKDAIPVQRSQFSRLVSQWGLSAAAVLIVVTSGFLFLQNIRFRGQVADFQKEQSTLKQQEKELRQQLSNEHFSNSEKQKELERIRARLKELEEQSAMKQQQAAKTFAFRLEPPTRGISKLPQFVLPMDAEAIAWTLSLEPNRSVAYLVTLKDPVRRTELWHSEQLIGHRSIQFNISASLLNTQSYSIELYGISRSGVKEIITSYPFRMVRQ